MSLHKIFMVLHEIMVTQCPDRAELGLVAGSTNFAYRWNSSAVVIL
jgi:hypothetical protein